MEELAKKLSGRFIVIDGPDGSGKSTQLELLARWLGDLGADVITTRDPGGTPIGDRIREILLDRDTEPISSMCETFLFMASRSQLAAERIRPAIRQGKVVLCDRFVSATVAYQGALGVDADTIIRLGNIAIGTTWPDLTILLDISVEEGTRRAGAPRDRLKHDTEPGAGQLSLFGDRLESRSSTYHERVREKFKKLRTCYPSPVAIVDAGGDIEQVQDRLRDVVAQWAKDRRPGPDG